MKRLHVHHSTVYRYKRPVRFGEHRMMFRPRDSHDLRLVSTALRIEPEAEVYWLHDVFSNSIAVAAPTQPSERLTIESRIEIEHYGRDDLNFPIAPFARSYPFSYPAEETPDLHSLIERHYADPEQLVDRWAKGFVQSLGGAPDTGYLLGEITRAIPREFGYERRYAVGTRTPTEMIEHGSGTCRDMALFMMEAVRSLGFAARFVTGYLHDPGLDQESAVPGEDAPLQAEMQGSGDTHAWVQVYLPGAGWVEFDPTNGLVGGGNLIRIGVTRDPRQAVPLQGSFAGKAEDFLDMTVDVKVTRQDVDGA